MGSRADGHTHREAGEEVGETVGRGRKLHGSPVDEGAEQQCFPDRLRAQPNDPLDAA